MAAWATRPWPAWKEAKIRIRVYIGAAILALVMAVFAVDRVLETNYAFLVLVEAFMCLALAEFFKLIGKKGGQPLRKTTLVMALLFVAVRWLHLRGDLSQSYDMPAVIVVVFALFLVQGIANKTTNAVQNVSGAIFAFMYVAFLGSYMLDLRFLSPGASDAGAQVVLAFILIAKSVDSGAYFVGRKLGRTKMSPVVSPKKTYEGLAGGLLCGVGAGMIIYYGFGWRIAPPGWLAVVCLAIGISGQLGDLAESMIKRDTGSKDSSVIPGLGGILDIVDCLLVSAPVTYYLLLLGPKP